MEANANTEAARTAFFPSINLGTGLVAANPILGPSSTALALAASLSAPIFEGGRLEGGLDKTQSREAELLENYRKTILVAFKEAEDAFAGVKAAKQRRQSLRDSYKSAKEAYQLAQREYALSIVDFQRVLNAQNALLAAEDIFFKARMEELTFSIDLYKAMGGGWLLTE